MVGVGEDGRRSILARVSVVNEDGGVVLDTFVPPPNTSPTTAPALRREPVDLRRPVQGDSAQMADASAAAYSSASPR